MLARRRPLPVIVLAALFAGCGVAPTPLVSPTPTGTFRLDSGGWVGYMPAVQITATN